MKIAAASGPEPRTLYRLLIGIDGAADPRSLDVVDRARIGPPVLFFLGTSSSGPTTTVRYTMTARHFPIPALLAALLLPAPLLAQTVVDIFPTTSGAWGLDYHDGFLWIGDDIDGFLRRVDPADGSVLETLPTPYDQNQISNGANHGVAWDGSGFWIAGDFGKDFLYKVSDTGTVLDTLPTPTDAVGGLSWNGTDLLVTSYYPNPTAGILRVDPSDGSVLETIPTQGTQPFGIAWDGTSSTLWNGMDDLEGDPEKIWNLDTLGNVLSSFDTPNTSPKGVALGGGYLWVIANTIEGSGRSLFKIDLTGAGTPDIDPVPAEQEFGIVALGDTGTRTQLLVNEGDGDLVISSVTTFSPFSFDALPLPITILPGEQIAFDVYFDPTIAGNFQANLQIESNDIDEGNLTVLLHGTGVPLDPTVLVSPGSLDFAETGVGMVRDRTLTITNRGFTDLFVDAVTSDDAQVRAFNLPELPLRLGTFEELSVQVLFEPDATGAHSAQLFVETTDPADPTTTVPVAGAGIVPSFEPGEPVWYADGIENVVSVLAGPDLSGDGRPEAVMESYDAGANGDPFAAFFGNSHGNGVSFWKVGEGTSGGWGDQCLALGPDLNQDGRAEVIRGTAWGGKRIEMRASSTGNLIWEYDTRADDNGGWVYSVAMMPDVSGDGIAEVLAAAGTDGQVFTGARSIYCFDGATGAVRFRQLSPDAFLSVGWVEDVNGDGVPDAIGGAGGNFEDDRVYCVSGASSGNATLLWTFSTGGSVWAVDAIEDVNGDGINDVIAGSWANRVFCLDGTDGSEVWSHTTAGDIVSLETIPDVTGDGVEDVVVGEIANFFRVLDGVTGEAHWFTATGGNVWSVSWIPDVDGDGVVDVIAGAQSDLVFCVSGASGDLIWSTNVGALVYSVRAIPDVTGNGTWDVLAGTQDLGGPGEGRIWCLEGGDGDVSGVDEDGPTPVTTVRLSRVSPNPMRDWVTFSVSAGADATGELGLEIFDAGGRRVRAIEQRIVPGVTQMVWDGRDRNGSFVVSGVYYYRLRGLSEGRTERGRVTLIR